MSESDDDYENLLRNDGHEEKGITKRTSEGKTYESLCYFYESSTSDESDDVDECEEKMDDENILEQCNADDDDDSLLVVYQ